MSQEDLDQFVQRYIAVWNEADDQTRRKNIAGLFAVDAEHFTPSVQVKGLEELEERVKKAHLQWVSAGEYYFRAVPGANGHHDAVRFNWEMVKSVDDEVISVGFDFILRAGDGLIHSDYQFIDR